MYPKSTLFEIDSILPPITESKYELEIRYNLSSNWMGSDENCIVLRGNRDTLEATYYYWHYFSKVDLKDKVWDSIRILHRYDKSSIPNRHGVYIKPLKPAAPLSSMLDILLKHHICESPDDDVVADSLRKKGIQPKVIGCMDCTDFALFEIKIGSHYRRLFVGNTYQNYNPDVPEFVDQRVLNEVFEKLIPDIRKRDYGW